MQTTLRTAACLIVTVLIAVACGTSNDAAPAPATEATTTTAQPTEAVTPTTPPPTDTSAPTTPTAVQTSPVPTAIPAGDVSPWTITESVDPLTDEKDIFAEVPSSVDSSILGYACFYTNDGVRNDGVGLFVSDDIWFSSNSSTWATIEYRLDEGEITDATWRRVDHRVLRPNERLFINILDHAATELVVRVHRDPAYDGNEGTTAVFDVSSFSAVHEQVYDQC